MKNKHSHNEHTNHLQLFTKRNFLILPVFTFAIIHISHSHKSFNVESQQIGCQTICSLAVVCYAFFSSFLFFISIILLEIDINFNTHWESKFLFSCLSATLLIILESQLNVLQIEMTLSKDKWFQYTFDILHYSHVLCTHWIGSTWLLCHIIDIQ